MDYSLWHLFKFCYAVNLCRSAGYYCSAIASAVILTVILSFSFSPRMQMEFAIQHTWDSSPVNHDPMKIIFSPGKGGLKMEVFGPFFNDPGAPASPPSQPFPGLWDYEGG